MPPVIEWEDFWASIRAFPEELKGINYTRIGFKEFLPYLSENRQREVLAHAPNDVLETLRDMAPEVANEILESRRLKSATHLESRKSKRKGRGKHHE